MGAVLAVHGGFVGGWYWAGVADQLTKNGHDVSVVEQLPSFGSDDPAQLGDLSADVAHVRAHLDDMEGPVTVIGHSAGGVVLTEIADHPAIGHTIYLAAMWPQQGESGMDVMTHADAPADWFTFRDDGVAYASDDVELVRERLFPEVDHDEAVELHRRFVPQSLVPLMTPCQAPARDHRTTFVICEHDRVLPPAAQEELAQRADHTERLACSHSASVVMPAQVAAIIERAAATN